MHKINKREKKKLCFKGKSPQRDKFLIMKQTEKQINKQKYQKRNVAKLKTILKILKKRKKEKQNRFVGLAVFGKKHTGNGRTDGCTHGRTHANKN
jgi:hypothetical protein